MKFISACKKFNEIQISKDLWAASTARKIRYYCKRINESTLATMEIEEITALNIDEFYVQEKKEIANNTIISIHSYLTSVFLYFYRAEVIQKNVMLLIEPPKYQKPEKTTYTADEIEYINEIIKTQTPRWQIINSILMYTGARRGEVAQIKYCDVDIRNHELTIYQTKTNKTLRYPLPEQLIRDIQADSYMFRKIKSEEPISPNAITCFYYRLGKQFKIHLNPHKFRHTVATLLYEAGASDHAVANQLGHSNPMITHRTYIHLSHTVPKSNLKLLAEKYEKIDTNK